VSYFIFTINSVSFSAIDGGWGFCSVFRPGSVRVL